MPRYSPGVEVSLTYSGVFGATDPSLGTAVVIVKSADEMHRWLVLNEFVSQRLAVIVGLPVPAGDLGVLSEDSTIPWVQLIVSSDSIVLPPGDLADAYTQLPLAVIGMLVFDTWICNDDRHEKNVIYSEEQGLWLIDHDRTIAGSTPDDLTTALDRRVGATPKLLVLDTTPGLRASISTDMVGEWIARIRAVPTAAIRNVTEEAYCRRLVTRPEQQALFKFIIERQNELQPLAWETLDLKGGDTWQQEIGTS